MKLAALIKQNKENRNELIDRSRVCRIILDDCLYGMERDNAEDTPSINPPGQPKQAVQVAEEDVIEVVDVENFDTNGLKARPKVPSTGAKLMQAFNALESRVVSLEKMLANGNARQREEIAHPLDCGDMDNAHQHDEIAQSNDLGNISIGAFENFINDVSFNTLEGALNEYEIENILATNLAN